MYTPPLFKKNDVQELHEFIEKHNFSTVITQRDSQPIASHLPLILDKSKGPQGTLVGHMARSNPQWKDFKTGQNILCVFNGPHAYVSPSWYIQELNVPTWNYSVVHAYGTAKIFEDNETLHKILAATVAFQESAFTTPWKFDLPEEFTNSLMKAIVGFEIEITDLQGKFKLSQNRSPQDRKGALSGLTKLGDEMSDAVVAMMKKEHEKL